MTACELLIDQLRQKGVDWMATLCGHGLDPLFHAARRSGMRLVDTRNEQTASYLAECYGRLTRRPGVCAVSSGVAHINALTGVANAYFDGSPMLLISGAGALETAGKGHFQEMDQVAAAAPLTRYARVVDDAQRTGEIFEEAWAAAHSGPAHLTFPMDVQTTEIKTRTIRPVDRPAAVDWPARSLPLECDRPLIIAGSEVFYSGEGARLTEFSGNHAIPMVIPIWDRGFIDRPASTYCGVAGAASGGPRLINGADCIILAGAIDDYRLGYLQTKAPILTEWRNLQCDRRFDRWMAEARRRRDEFRRSIHQRGADQAKAGAHAVHIIAALTEVMTPEAALIIDGGSIGQWAHQTLCSERYPGHWLTCGRSGVVGYGIGGAMAARLAFPDRPVILLSGDGAFTFNVAELECAVRQKLPFVAIVADDQAWGITRAGHMRQFGEPIGSALGPIAFDRLAESLGAHGVVARTPAEIAPALRQAMALPVVTVIHVPVVGGNPA